VANDPVPELPSPAARLTIDMVAVPPSGGLTDVTALRPYLVLRFGAVGSVCASSDGVISTLRLGPSHTVLIAMLLTPRPGRRTGTLRKQAS
jgi:hypothetical protein